MASSQAAPGGLLWHLPSLLRPPNGQAHPGDPGGARRAGRCTCYFLIIFSHSRRCSTSMSMIDDLSELFVDAFIYRIYTLCSFCFFSFWCVCVSLSLSLSNCFFTFFLFIHTFIPCTTSWFLQDLHEHFLHRKPWQ